MVIWEYYKAVSDSFRLVADIFIRISNNRVGKKTCSQDHTRLYLNDALLKKDRGKKMQETH